MHRVIRRHLLAFAHLVVRLRLIDGGDRIVVPVHVQARAKNGKVMDVHNVWIYEFSERKLIRGRVYADTAVLRDTVEAVIPA